MTASKLTSVYRDHAAYGHLRLLIVVHVVHDVVAQTTCLLLMFEDALVQPDAAWCLLSDTPRMQRQLGIMAWLVN